MSLILMLYVIRFMGEDYQYPASDEIEWYVKRIGSNDSEEVLTILAKAQGFTDEMLYSWEGMELCESR